MKTEYLKDKTEEFTPFKVVLTFENKRDVDEYLDALRGDESNNAPAKLYTLLTLEQ